MQKVNIIGAGLAGVEAALYLANIGVSVNLFEMRPKKNTLAHKTPYFAELVCSNSLKNKMLTNACGLLKEEVKILGSSIIKVANKVAIPGGNALVVDRDSFSKTLDKTVREHPLINVINEEVVDLPKGITIVASGPLTSKGLEKTLSNLLGEESLFFFDASAPLIEISSIDMEIAYFKSRYHQGDDSYINCPFTKDEYDIFYNELIKGKIALVHEFDKKYFSACMPIEVLAKKGKHTLRYGPLKPKGLEKEGRPQPYAVAQLRQDNALATLYNLVGFQTNLTYGEQERIFRLIPGLKNAKFTRFGLMHRNTYLNAPKLLNLDMSLKNNPNIYIAGQLSGVEGYVESAASGLYVAINVYRRLNKLKPLQMPPQTMLGALINYIIKASPKHFTPMNANFGLFPTHSKKEREQYINNALDAIKLYKEEIE